MCINIIKYTKYYIKVSSIYLSQVNLSKVDTRF